MKESITLSGTEIFGFIRHAHYNTFDGINAIYVFFYFIMYGN